MSIYFYILHFGHWRV